jgi:hypothetical protein
VHVVDQRDHWSPGHERRQERHAVLYVENDIRPDSSGRESPRRLQVDRVPAASPSVVDALADFVAGLAGDGGAQQRDPVAGGGKALRYPLDVQLTAAPLRVTEISPVADSDVRPTRRDRRLVGK